MADAICGPSNALQSFQKQSSIDRTLQQDRFTSLHSPAEGFRSFPGPGAGLLDAEFEAFQTSSPLETGYPEPPSFHHDLQINSPRGNFPQPDWALDFQNMQLHEQRTSPLSSSQFHQHAPLHHTSPNGCHQDFLRQSGHPNKQLSHHFQPSYQSSFQKASAFFPAAMPMHNHHEQFTAGSNSKQEKGEQCAAQENEMFSEAFQEVEANVDYQQQLDLEKQNHMRFKTHEEQRRQTAEQGGHLKNSSGFTSNPRFKSAESVSNAASQPAAYRIGSDKLLDEEHTTRDDADELARTAGNLLESVKSDTSKKFQESNFLSLMRQLRDREVTVDGDKIVDTTQPLHPGGTHYPHDSVAEGGLSDHLTDDSDLFRSSRSEALSRSEETFPVN